MTLSSRLFKRFDILGLSGKGGHSRIYKLRHTHTNKLYALKEVGLDSHHVRACLAEQMPYKHRNLLSYQGILVSPRPPELEYFQDGDNESRPSSGLDEVLREITKEKFTYTIAYHHPIFQNVNTTPKHNTIKEGFCNNGQDGFLSLFPSIPTLPIFDLSYKKRKLYYYLITDYADLTLRDLIDYRNDTHFNRPTACNVTSQHILAKLLAIPLAVIFKEILMGLHFLHSRKITHCDLKPSNIFFVENTDPKIGDFGLINECESDMDLVGAGLLFFELLWPMDTVMERVITLGRIKDQLVFPDEFVNVYPKEAELIRMCIEKRIRIRKLIRKLDPHICQKKRKMT